ncbi:MAG: sigma-70 family RNA polymerase sigma factor [Acidobacteriota bacterium]
MASYIHSQTAIEPKFKSGATRWLRWVIRKIKWEIDEVAFNKLLLHFDADVHRAAQLYELMRDQLIRFFESRGCKSAPELTDATFNRVMRKIAEGTEIAETAIGAYLYSVARNVLKEYWHNAGHQNIELNELPPSLHPAENPNHTEERLERRLERERKLECLESCVQKLSETERKMILSYYQGETGLKIENRKKLAERFNLTLTTLRTRIFRIRERLERCVEDCYEKFTGQ